MVAHGLQARWSLIPFLVVIALLAALLLSQAPASASHLTGPSATYTLDADFDEGTLVAVNHDTPNNNQLQLDSIPTPFDFIWVAVSTNGTVVKIDTNTGAVLAEYSTAPAGRGVDPSRTTVDNNGNVWVTNRAEGGSVAANAIAPGTPPVGGGMGSLVHIGLEENGQCVDRNGNGAIDTSTGLGDIRAWTNAGGADNLGGVSTAADECIIHYTRVNSTGTRHVSVDANNNVWVSGIFDRDFDLVSGSTGMIIQQAGSVGFGGYGGLIDPSGVIWSARPFLRWPVANPLAGPNGDPPGTSIGPLAPGFNWAGQFSPDSYGLCIDGAGNVWNTDLGGGVIRKYAPDGTFLGAFGQGNAWAQGCVADLNGDVWVAHSIIGPQTTVGHLKNDGTYVGTVAVGSGPTGVAVDSNGKVWATNYNSRTVSRIDPAAGPIGGGGFTVGAVDFTTVDLGGNLYNYSDMTGSTLIAPPSQGTWTVVHDGGQAGISGWTISWTSQEPSGSSIAVSASASDDSNNFPAGEAMTNGGQLSSSGQYVKVVVTFTRGSDGDGDGVGDTPILFDLTLTSNEPPDCSAAAPSISAIWPPNHQFVDISILGVTDPDGDPVTITIDSIFQDEPVDTTGDGAFVPDGTGVGTSTASVRAERTGTPKVPGNGRVYHIGFTASDGQETCSGEVRVGVPHDQGPKGGPVDGGALYDSTT